MNNDLSKKVKMITDASQEIFQPFDIVSGCKYVQDDTNTDVRYIYTYITISKLELIIMSALTIDELLKKTLLLRDSLASLTSHANSNFMSAIYTHLSAQKSKRSELSVISRELDTSFEIIYEILSKNLENNESSEYLKSQH